jgi:hypothetical protein
LIEVSARYIPHIAALALVAAVPTVLHSLGRFDVQDCAAPEAILAPPGPEVSPSDRKRFDRNWGAGNWTAGSLPGGEDGEGGQRLEYVIARSFDPKAVYHWPESRVVWDVRPEQRGVERIEADGVRLPVHRAYYEAVDGSRRETLVVAYLLVYHARPVGNPYLAQILSGPQQVVSGRRPMWLYLVHGRMGERERPAAEERAHAWLASAWQRHRSACAR